MHRSDINKIIQEAQKFIASFDFALPPFAFWRLSDWQNKQTHITHIIETGLGWDVTDHGLGEFEKNGLVLFTLRNGNPANPSEGYAEKLIISQVGQIIPFHFHKQKTEDIINRGGGLLKIEFSQSNKNEELSTDPFDLYIDGMKTTYPTRSIITLKPGSSVHIPPYLYHRFWAEEADVLIGEVSSINDDRTDNYFLEEIGRFPSVTEDESIIHPLVSDYEKQFQ